MDMPADLGRGADRLELLQTFVRIIDAGSLSAAAAQLGTTQPTVSRRLRALESALGLQLLQRSTHRMKLTEDGERCLVLARGVLDSWQELDGTLRGAAAEPEGLLRVVVPHAFGQAQLVGPLADYLTRHPKVDVEWLLHDRRPDFLADGVDCAIHVGELEPDASVVAVPLGQVQRSVVAAPALLQGRPEPAHPQVLADWPWLALRTFYRDSITLATAAGDQVTLPIRPRFSTDSLYALRSAAVLGLGVCVSSRWLIQDDINAGRLQPLLPGWQAAPLPVHLLYPHQRLRPARLRRFIELVKDVVPAAFGS
jgi:DNA-binding transcriptional LysR family regulator